MKNLILFVGPPASGKTTMSDKFVASGYKYINQDSQGKNNHWIMFLEALNGHEDIVVDRMNFSKEQRNRYIQPAKEKGYNVEIRVVHENYDTCLRRALARVGHETIKNETDARKALNFFFSKYERVEDTEADCVIRLYPNIGKNKAVVIDLDGTICDIEHRLKYVKQEKKDWKKFFDEIPNDVPNQWCVDIAKTTPYQVVYCSGRPNIYRQQSVDWLKNYGVYYNHLYMRSSNDFRKDDIIKEILLDFELLTRFDIQFVIDDRKQVVDMWRRRGYVCLQPNEGNF